MLLCRSWRSFLCPCLDGKASFDAARVAARQRGLESLTPRLLTTAQARSRKWRILVCCRKRGSLNNRHVILGRARLPGFIEVIRAEEATRDVAESTQDANPPHGDYGYHCFDKIRILQVTFVIDGTSGSGLVMLVPGVMAQGTRQLLYKAGDDITVNLGAADDTVTISQVKARLTEAYDAALAREKEQTLQRSLTTEKLDVTLPGRPVVRGRLHPSTQVLRSICAIC